MNLKKLSDGGTRIGKQPFGRAIENFYLSNPIARASAIMAELSVMHGSDPAKATGTDG